MTVLEKNRMKMRLLEAIDEFLMKEFDQCNFPYSDSTSLYMAQAAFAVIEQSIESSEVCES